MSDANKVTVRFTAEDKASKSFKDIAKESETASAKIKDAMHKVKQAATVAVSGLAALGAFRFGGMIKESIDTADEISKLSQKTGLATETLSVLKHQADLAGTSLDGVARGVRVMAQNLVEAQDKGGDAEKMFGALGVNIASFGRSGADVERLLGVIADRFADMEDGADKTDLAIKVFGKSGLDLIPILNEGSSGMAKAAEEAQRFGLVVSSSAAKSAEEFNDALTRMNKSAGGLAASIGAWLTDLGVADAAEIVFSASARGYQMMTEAGRERLQQAEAMRLEMEYQKKLGFETLADYREFKAMQRDADRAGLQPRADDADSFYRLRKANEQLAAAEAAERQRELTDAIVANDAAMKNAALSADLYAMELKALADTERRGDFGAGIRAGISETRADLEDFFAQGRAMTLEFLQGTNRDWQTLYFDTMQQRLSSLGDFFGQFFNVMLVQLQRIAAQQAANATTSLLTSGLSLIFPGASAAGAPAVSSGQPSGLIAPGAFGSGFEPPMEARAAGGPVLAGRSYVVGEKQAELFRPREDGMIQPSVSAGGGASVSITIFAVDAQSFAALAAQNADGLFQIVVSVAGKDPSARNALRGALG